MSAWGHSNSPFNYDATPIFTSSLWVIIYNKTSTRWTWDFRGRNGYSIGPALHHYICHTAVDATTKSNIISDTVEYWHSYDSQPTLTSEDRIVHALNFLSCAIKDAPDTAQHNHLEAISKLQDLFWSLNLDTAL